MAEREERRYSGDTERGGGEEGGRPGRYAPRSDRFERPRRRRVCPFCAAKVDDIDYKNVELLSRFLSDRGRMRGRRHTAACAKHQRRLAVALKRARHLALLPYAATHVRGG